jgi:D-alanyl-lipoteichoic acid acyltransferase DltB (MBOAT superfamily)
MVFTSLAFIIFYIIVFAIYWLPGKDGQNRLVVASGLVFYGWWDWRFAVLLLVTTGIDYGVGLALEREHDDRRRRAWLLLSLVTNLGVLGFFKYFNFFADSFVRFSAQFGMHPSLFTLKILLPMGISFYTFQALSYTIDVYRRELDAVHDPIRYFSFILFFPHLVAGPIVRAKDLLGQFNRRRVFDPEPAPDALRQVLWGFFIKVVIADNLAPIVGVVRRHRGRVRLAAPLRDGVLRHADHCDFAGYTHIAIGCARLLGIELMRNFAYPFSRSIPSSGDAGTSARGVPAVCLIAARRQSRHLPAMDLNILIVFLVSGLWHGANWTFVRLGPAPRRAVSRLTAAWPESGAMADGPPADSPSSFTAIAQMA